MSTILVIRTPVWAALVVGLVVLLAAVAAIALLQRDRRRARADADAAVLAVRAEEHDRRIADRARLFLRLEHELKNPLTALRAAAASTAQLIGPPPPGDADEPDEVHATLDTMGRSARRIARLLADLRRLADVGTRPLTLHPLDIGPIVEQAVDDAGTATAAQGRTITVSIPTAPWPLPKIAGDGDLLHQAVLNLVTNAVKYSSAPAPIEVRAQESVDAQGSSWVVVEVADTGLGIPPDEQEEVWDDLARGSQIRSIPGSGIGLPMVRAIVERHAGQVSLVSRSGEGTSVRMLFPVLPAAR